MGCNKWRLKVNEITDYTKLEQIVESNSDVILDMAAIKPFLLSFYTSFLHPLLHPFGAVTSVDNYIIIKLKDEFCLTDRNSDRLIRSINSVI
jgi:hypothetical protein